MRRAEQVNQLREGVVGMLAPATDPPQDRLLTGLVKLDENAIAAKLVSRKSVNKYLRDQVLAEAQPLYAA